MLEHGRHDHRIELLLAVLDDRVHEPDGQVAEYAAILGQIEIPQTVLVLPRRVLELKRLQFNKQTKLHE